MATCRLAVPSDSDPAISDSMSLLFVVSAAGKGDIMTDGQHVARYRDVAGDPRSYVCPPVLAKKMWSSKESLVCIVTAEKTKSEALLDVDMRWADVRQIRERLRSIVQSLQTDLAQPVPQHLSSNQNATDLRQHVRDAFEAETQRLWQLAR